MVLSPWLEDIYKQKRNKKIGRISLAICSALSVIMMFTFILPAVGIVNLTMSIVYINFLVALLPSLLIGGLFGVLLSRRPIWLCFLVGPLFLFLCSLLSTVLSVILFMIERSISTSMVPADAVFITMLLMILYFLPSILFGVPAGLIAWRLIHSNQMDIETSGPSTFS